MLAYPSVNCPGSAVPSPPRVPMSAGSVFPTMGGDFDRSDFELNLGIRRARGRGLAECSNLRGEQ